MSEPAEHKWGPLAWLGVGLCVAIALMVILGALSFWTYGGDYGYGMMGGGFGWWAALMMGIPAVFLIVILFVVLSELSRPVAPRDPTISRETPLDSLERRYAQGAVSRDDYVRIREDLIRGTGPS